MSDRSPTRNNGGTTSRKKMKLNHNNPGNNNNNNNNLLDIVVKVVSKGDSTPINMKIATSTTVLNLKQSIMERAGISIERQRLIFFGKLLDDNAKRLYGPTNSINMKLGTKNFVHLSPLPPNQQPRSPSSSAARGRLRTARSAGVLLRSSQQQRQPLGGTLADLIGDRHDNDGDDDDNVIPMAAPSNGGPMGFQSAQGAPPLPLPPIPHVTPGPFAMMMPIGGPFMLPPPPPEAFFLPQQVEQQQPISNAGNQVTVAATLAGQFLPTLHFAESRLLDLVSAPIMATRQGENGSTRQIEATIISLENMAERATSLGASLRDVLDSNDDPDTLAAVSRAAVLADLASFPPGVPVSASISPFPLMGTGLGGPGGLGFLPGPPPVPFLQGIFQQGGPPLPPPPFFSHPILGPFSSLSEATASIAGLLGQPPASFGPPGRGGSNDTSIL
jgi:hypothetical protein